MSRESYIFGIVLFGIISGLFSPFLLVGQIMISALAPGFLVSSAAIVLMLTSILVSTATIMAGGVPAALYERVTGQSETNGVSWFIWLASTALFALPAVINGIGILAG